MEPCGAAGSAFPVRAAIHQADPADSDQRPIGTDRYPVTEPHALPIAAPLAQRPLALGAPTVGAFGQVRSHARIRVQGVHRVGVVGHWCPQRQPTGGKWHERGCHGTK